MTLVLLATLAGLGQLCARTAIPLPRLWAVLVGWGIAVILYHQRQLIAHAAYFDFFQETALFCNGLLVLVTLTWGAWALRQLPLPWLRRMRWLGLACLLSNGIIVILQHAQLWQAGAFPLPHPSGLFPLDRLLGAYALAWLPICWVWWAPLAVVPGLLILASGKPFVIAWAVVSLCWLTRRWWPLLVGTGAIWLLRGYSIPLRLSQRLDTWGTLSQYSLEAPWVGHGFHPMVYATHPLPLPNPHSDWLALAFHAGWITVGFVGLLAWTVWHTPTHTTWGEALRISLVSLAGLSLVQSTLAHACVSGLALLFLVWWSRETEKEPGNEEAYEDAEIWPSGSACT